MNDPDVHRFDVVRLRDYVRVICQDCRWHTGYQMNDERARRVVKEAAILHRATATLKEKL